MNKDYLVSWIGSATAIGLTDVSAIASIGVSITTMIFTYYRWKNDKKDNQ